MPFMKTKNFREVEIVARFVIIVDEEIVQGISQNNNITRIEAAKQYARGCVGLGASVEGELLSTEAVSCKSYQSLIPA